MLDLVREDGKDAVVVRILVVGLVVWSAACGDNLLPDGTAIPHAANLTIVAHQDDDLLFMQPDLADIADLHEGMTNVYVTAGNGKGGLDVAEPRYAGLMEAYAETSGVTSNWTCGVLYLAGHAAEHCALEGAPVSLVFLGYPDGGKRGEQPDSLLHLFQGSASNVETIGHSAARYDRAGLIAAISEVIRATYPSTIRTLEVSTTHGLDHSDHTMVGALALLAVAEAGYGGELLAFRGYDTANDPPTLDGPLYERSKNMLAHYDACVKGCAECGAACPSIDQTHEVWLHRRYAVGFRARAEGFLRTGATCLQLDPDGHTLSLADDCAIDESVELAADGQLSIGDKCIEVTDQGVLRATPRCAPEAARRFYLDEDGYLWNGAPALPSTVTDTEHLRCVVAEEGQLVLRTCGAALAQRWQITWPAIAIPRPSWLPSTGRAVRVKGDQVFAVVGGQLLASAPATTEELGAMTVIGALAVEPESLVIGRLGGLERACGRDAEGIACVALASAPMLERWSGAFADPGPVSAKDRSLAVFGTDVCGLSGEGLICAPRGSTLVTDVRSRWPRPDATLWVGSLDGDRGVDWCAATTSGMSCGRAADRIFSGDALPWSFAFHGISEAAPANASVGALYDFDGDHRDDVCRVEAGEIRCARNQGRGFGPSFSIGPAPATATGLWFRRGRACVDDGTTLTCTPLPRAD